MKQKNLALLLLCKLGLACGMVSAAEPAAMNVRLEDSVPVAGASKQTFLFYGGALVERLMEEGVLEAYLQKAWPGDGLTVRSLAWTGDELGYRLRPEGYVDHLKSLLVKWPATTVVLGFGNNESFEGEKGLAQFEKDWDVYLAEIRRIHPGAKLILLSPTAVDGGGASYLESRGREIAAYSKVVKDVAQREGALFVDLHSATLRAFSEAPGRLTSRGVDLNSAGVRLVSKVIAKAVLGESVVLGMEQAPLEEVAKAASAKAALVAEVVRPKNGVVYYGVRKRQEENEAEVPRYHRLIEMADEAVHDLARHPGKLFRDCARPSLPPLPEGKSVPDRFSGGVLKEPLEQAKDLVVADGYDVNLFASEAEFPDLKNPVQMAFDARGRLWVVTMPSFPHTIPGEVANDKILILEDTKHQGRADKCTVFAEGFDALDGVAFHELGVVVSAQPKLLLLKDVDGDGRADTREELLRGIDVTDSHHGGTIAVDPIGNVLFSDGVFHRSQFETPFGVVRGIDSTGYRLDPHSGRVLREWQSMTPNPWKMAFDRFGSRFQRFGGGHVLDAVPLTWTPLGVYHPYGNGTVVNYAKGSGTCVVSSPNFPEKYQQGIVSASLLGSYSVSMAAADSAGGCIAGVDRIDLLSSQNSAFRPVDTAFGFDGGLYVSDFASRIIGHAQHPMRDPQWNHTRGRIWRVVSKTRPVVSDFARIEGATVAELLELLSHPQDIVREHARIELRKHGASVIPVLAEWIKGLVPGVAREQVLLEASWLAIASGQPRAGWVAELMKSSEPRMRAAAVELLRHSAGQLHEAETLLREASRDPHPRVRMSVVNAVSHLRGDAVSHAGADAAVNDGGHHAHSASKPLWESVLEGMVAVEPGVRQMINDLQAGVRPRKGRSIPVLDVDPATKVQQWMFVREEGSSEMSAYPSNADAMKARAAAIKTRLYRTFVRSARSQTVLLNVRHGYMDVSANGVQVLSVDTPYSPSQQVGIELREGLNVLEIAYRKLSAKSPPPAVYVCDLLGRSAEGAVFAVDAEVLKAMSVEWDALHAADLGSLRVQAVPNLMQFAPRELRVQAGKKVRLVFENPDLMQHNLVLVKPGADEEVGLLADQMAAKPEGMARNFVPDSKKILHAIPLVEPNGKFILEFIAPEEKGSYGYLCTFPGHWRVMRGVLLVE